MKHVLRIFLVLVFTTAFATLAQAQATRTCVSGTGDDANPCSRTAPCKTFAGAISHTGANGEIDALDPGGFGVVTITKSITIDGTTGAGFGGILAAATNGVIINDAGSNSINVTLRNLSIDGNGSGLDGIKFASGRRLVIENCTVFGFTSDGLEISPSSGTNFNVTVNNSSFFRNNIGIRQATAVGTLNCSYDRVNVSQNTSDGFQTTGGTANIHRSVFDSNGGNGISASNGAVVNATDNESTSNTNGFNCATPSTMRLNNNTAYRNTTGVTGTGTIQSFINNEVIGNGTDVAVGTVISSVSGTNTK